MRRNCKEVNYKDITINTMKADENFSRSRQDWVDMRAVLEIKSTVLGYWLGIGVWQKFRIKMLMNFWDLEKSLYGYRKVYKSNWICGNTNIGTHWDI